MGWPDVDTFVTDAELNNYVNDSVRELHSLLIGLYPAGQFAMQSAALPVAAGQSLVLMPNDFGRLVSLRMLIADSWVPLEPLDVTTELMLLSTRSWDYARVKYILTRSTSLIAAVQLFPPPAAPYTLQLFYTLLPPTYAADADVSYLGEDEYTILDCCVKCAVKQEQDAAPYLAQKQAYEARLAQQATPLDLGRGPTVQDVMSSASREDIWWFRR
jgi:hypothetical protein